jgi:creatinine amidohydrolase
MTTEIPQEITDSERAFREQFVSWNLAELSYVDIRAYLEEKDLVLVPMASTEQHGPHLPLYCDSTLLALMEDVARSLIHHGFNRIIFVNGHGSNIKVVDPVLRKLRYETGALIGLVKPYMERYVGVVEGVFENPPEETPGWHSSEWETSQCLAWNESLVRMDRAEHTPTSIPDFLPDSFRKLDGAPDVEFEGYTYFNFPMDHHEFTETGVIGNPMRATKEKGEESFRRYSEHVARGVLELMQVPVKVENREFVDRVL